MPQEQDVKREKNRLYMRQYRARKAGMTFDGDDLPIAPGPKPKKYADYMRDERRKTSIHTLFRKKMDSLRGAGRFATV